MQQVDLAGTEHQTGPKYFVDIEGHNFPWAQDTITTERIAQLGGWDSPRALSSLTRTTTNASSTRVRWWNSSRVKGLPKKCVSAGADMYDRIEAELGLLRTRFCDLEYRPDGRWVRIPSYPLPAGWNRTHTDIAFQIPTQYPANPPYGFYVPVGLTYDGQRPNNCADNNAPLFGGNWMLFSWQPDGNWIPAADPRSGHNLLNWAIGFRQRFAEGV